MLILDTKLESRYDRVSPFTRIDFCEAIAHQLRNCDLSKVLIFSLVFVKTTYFQILRQASIDRAFSMFFYIDIHVFHRY